MNHLSSSGEEGNKQNANNQLGEDRQSKQMAYAELLASKLLDGTITSEEKKWLNDWYDGGLEAEDEAALIIPEAVASSEAAHREKLRLGIQKKIKDSQSRSSGTSGKLRSLPALIKWSAAAAVLLILVTSPWWRNYFTKSTSEVAALAINQTKATPGKQGAILKLPDGSQICLDSVSDGQVFKKGGLEVVKKNGTLQYLGASKEIVYNDIFTNKGRQWKMFLPDGTEVLLNAGSSLHFPVSFQGQPERVVTLKGEAYFKVVHDDRQPFKVIAGNQVIEDIGTSFNVHAYEDENEVKTTLVEGALKVNSVLLAPGWQASTDADGHLKTKTVNLSDVTAWVNGQLSLNNLSVEELMRQISRWYNVEVVYETGVPKKVLRSSGMLDKYTPMEDIVKSLRDFGVDVTLKDNKLYIRN